MAGSGFLVAASHPFCRGVQFSVFRILQVTHGQPAAKLILAVRSDLRQGWSDAWHLWRVIMPRRSMPVGSFGEWYGGATVADRWVYKNSSSIRMTVIRNVS